MNYKKLSTPEKEKICKDYFKRGVSMRIIAKEYGIKERTLFDWVSKYRAGGFRVKGIKIRKPPKKVLQENEELKRSIKVLKELDKFEESKIEIKTQKKEEERTAFIIASDWHIEERVRPETIHGLNEFNIDIARQRAISFFSNSVELLKREDVDEVVLALLGDFITGYIHEELEEGNQLSPTRALWLCFELLGSGIEYMLKATNYNFIVPCVVGNHGRTTGKRRIESAVDNSYEWLLYKQLKDKFNNNPRVNIQIAAGKMMYLKVYDKIVRLTHGDQIRGGGGVGGVSVPIIRKLLKWNSIKKADLTCIGHFHQRINFSNPAFVCNGSLVGFNTFAEEIAASPEPPAQSFFIFSKTHGVTTSCPIFLQ